MFSSAMESMQAVTSSKLGRELEALFQSVIDYRDKNLEDVNFDAKRDALKSFFAKNVAKKFMDIVWKETGLYIVKTYFSVDGSVSFCTWMCYGQNAPRTQDGTFQIEGVLNGQANAWVNDWFSKKEFTVEEVIRIASSFDIEKGIIKPQFRKEMKKWIQCAIGFDIALGFLTKDYLPKNSGVDYLTARELTAIMLHEIGHNLTLIEHAADMYAHISAFNALQTAFEARATPKQAIELAKYAVDFGSRAGLNVDAGKLAGVVEQAQKDMSDMGKATANKLGERSFLIGLICSAFILIGESINILFDIAIIDPTRWTYRMSQNKKVGDTMIHERMWTWQERKADEYAMTHGYGADQVTALEKIMKFFRFIGRSQKDIEEILRAERSGQHLSLFSKIRLFSIAHCMMSDLGYRMYPPGSQRYREILNLTIKNLKAHGASAAYVAKYMKDIETILEAIDKMSKEDKYIELSMKRYQCFMKYTSVKSFFAWLMHGRVDTEMAELLDDIQKLSNNLLTYFGFKLSELAKKA